MFMILTAAWRLSWPGIRGELPGKGKEVVGDFLIGPLFGYFAAAEALKISGDHGHGANGI
jgi:hypothetical protein